MHILNCEACFPPIPETSVSAYPIMYYLDLLNIYDYEEITDLFGG